MVLEYGSGIPGNFKLHILRTLPEVLPTRAVRTSCVLPSLLEGDPDTRKGLPKQLQMPMETRQPLKANVPRPLGGGETRTPL